MKQLLTANLLWLPVLAIILTPQGPASAQHKLQVSDPALAKQITSQGGRLIADYGSYQLFDTGNISSELEANSQVENRDEYNSILLNAKPLDTSKPEVKGLRRTVGQFKGKHLHLVHFVGPVQPEWREQLVAAGLEVVSYIPQNAYLVYGDAKSISRLQDLASKAPHVQWEGVYADDYKLHPAALPVDERGNARQIGTEEFSVQLVADEEANAETMRLVDQMKLAPLGRPHAVLNYFNFVVRLAPSNLKRLAAQPDVVSIHAHFPPTKFCERQDQIIAGNLAGNAPTGPGYLAWLAGKGFTQAQFTSSGFAVDVTDSGVDNGTQTPNHFGLYLAGDLTKESRVIYNRLEGFPNPGTTNSGCDGHGTLNTHVVAGFNDRAAFPNIDGAGFHFGLGVCPFVKVGSSVIFDPDFFTGPNYSDLQSRAYRDGARVSNNSWGSNVAGDYDSQSQEYDALVRDAQPARAAVPAPGNQEMVIVFAAGNQGPGAQTIGSPATGKNVITVGAAENVQPFNGNDGCGVGTGGANSANDIIGFSSRGPCTDGRHKPDIMAPGTHVSGGVAQASNPGPNGTADPCYVGTGVCGGAGGSLFYPPGQELFTASSGTSHSSPCVVGGCALVRQYFINNSANPPSPAMTKAYLVNSARYMNGSGANDTLPSNNQGMGEMNLGTAFDGSVRILRDEVAADLFTGSGQARTFNATISDTNKPFRVTVAWTDAPGSTSGNAFNNNLDLIVTIGTNVYKGNVFNKGLSIVGGAADAKDNLESVFLPAGVSGDVSVTVLATSINSDGVPNNGVPLDQDFALVIYNAAVVPASILTQPASQTVVAGLNVSFSVVAAGTAPLSYQWKFKGANLPGATTSTLTLNNVQTNQAGGYSVVVTNAAGMATSTLANLNVLFLPPTIISQPADLTIEAGEAASFSATAFGALPLGYQWQFMGNNLAGATSNVLTLIDVHTNQAGGYAVVATNAAGIATSSVAILRVSPRIPVKAWGNDDYGQTATFSALTNAVAIAAGGFHSLALLKDGSVIAWGDDFDGQCDVPPDLTNAVAIAGGGYHTLAARADGSVVGWGAFYDGQINAPEEATNVVAVAGGRWHSLGLRADGTVVAWGDNSSGQTVVPPQAVNVVAIAAGGQHSLALRSDGTVVAWGSDSGADGTFAGQVDVPWDLNQVVAIGAGDFHSIALKADGTVVVWGDNSQGEASVPVDLSRAVAIAAGGAHSLAVKEGGVVVAWGDNLFSQSVVGANISSVSAVAAGSYHSVALLDQSPIPPRLTDPIWQGNVLSLSLATVAGKAYFLQYKGVVTDTSWISISGIVGNGTIRTISDPSANVPYRFYRVRQQ